jgi:hypothetical protein
VSDSLRFERDIYSAWFNSEVTWIHPGFRGAEYWGWGRQREETAGRSPNGEVALAGNLVLALFQLDM